MMKIIKAIVASAVFMAALTSIYVIHVIFFRVDVVFYAAILDGVMASLIAGTLLITLPYFKSLGAFEKSQLIIIWLISAYALAISVPTVIDRSLSFYILEKIQQRSGGIRQDAFEKIFTTEYVKEHRLVDVRLTEQLESGTIAIINNCVILTKKGKTIAAFSRHFRQNWLPKKRLLLGEYTDTLTDPFRSSEASVDYTCQP